MSMDHMPWDALPLLPMLNVCRFLTTAELCKASQVCRSWNEISESDDVWREVWSSLSISTKRGKQDESLKRLYARKATKFAGVVQWEHFYSRLKPAKTRLMNWLNDHAPDIAKTVKKKALPSELLRLESLCGWVPDEMKVWWLMCRGQAFATTRGIFGGYRVYELAANMGLMDIVNATNMVQNTRSTKEGVPDWLKKCVPFASDNVGGGVIWCFAVEDIAPEQYPVPAITRGTIVVPCWNYRTCMPIAENFTCLLEDWVARLESNVHPVVGREIQRFPDKGVPEEVTNGVKIQVSPLFIYEESQPGRQYSWAYRVFMSMDQSCQPEEDYSCQLTTRYWDITDATGHKEIVSGPGVIGLYPKMFPGASFEYESRCPLSHPSGFMEGSFEMIKKDGSVFKAVVPKFALEIPKIIRDNRKM